MALREILVYPDSRLRQVSKPVTEFGEDLKELVRDMAETMYDAPGIGLAAIQVNVPLRETTPTLPCLWMYPGMIPILHSPGVMTPGQLGPINREGWDERKRRTRTMSRTGIPSVMQITNSTPASAASMIASAAKGGGT